MTDDSDTKELEEGADKIVAAALDGDSEALKELVQSGALDDFGDDGRPSRLRKTAARSTLKPQRRLL